MKCYIKTKCMDRDIYFAKHLGIEMCPNKWVMFKEEAQLFDSVDHARKAIKKFNLKRCEVEKCPTK